MVQFLEVQRLYLKLNSWELSKKICKLKPALGGFLVVEEVDDDHGVYCKSANHAFKKQNTAFHPCVPRRYPPFFLVAFPKGLFRGISSSPVGGSILNLLLSELPTVNPIKTMSVTAPQKSKANLRGWVGCGVFG